MRREEEANSSTHLGGSPDRQSCPQHVPMGIFAPAVLLIVSVAHGEGLVGEQIGQNSLPEGGRCEFRKSLALPHFGGN